MIDWKRSTTLVTGASSGIGYAIAEILARRGSRIVLVARESPRLREAAAKLAAIASSEPVVIPLDLYDPGAPSELLRETERLGIQVDVLVNNAGHGLHGRFAEQDSAALGKLIQLDVVSVAMIARAFLPGMLARGRGAVLNVSSIAAFVPFPTQAVYGASKAFVLSLSEALWAETRGTGVHVMALCPGATDTGFFRTLGQRMNVSKVTPESVAKEGVDALDRGAMTVVPGFVDWLRCNLVARLLPRRVAARFMKFALEQTYR